MRKPNRLGRFLNLIRQHAWFVTLAFAICVGAAIASLLLINPAKDAEFRADVAIQNAPPLFDSGNLPKTDDFAAVATSANALKQTSDALAADGLSISPDELANRLVATARRDTSSIDFAVKYEDANTALFVARAWSDVSLRLMREEAPALQRAAAAPARTQLEQAAAELARRRTVVSDLGGPVVVGQAAGGQYSLIATEYQTKIAAIAAKGVERTNLQSVLDSLRTGIGDGAILSNSQLRLLLAGVLPADAPLEGSLSAQQAEAALQLRLNAVDGSLVSMRQEAQMLQTALDQRGGDLQKALTEMQAAEDNYQAAARVVQSYETAAGALSADASLIQSPHVNRNSASEWATRIGAAAAIALFVAALGTLLLSRLSRRDRTSVAAVPSTTVRPQPSPISPLGQESTLVSKPRRGKARRPAEALFTALAAAFLAGLLGTFAARQRNQHTARLSRRR